jgi:hypothetical protein
MTAQSTFAFTLDSAAVSGSDQRLVPSRIRIAESAKIVLALIADSANVSLLPLSDTNTNNKNEYSNYRNNLPKE